MRLTPVFLIAAAILALNGACGGGEPDTALSAKRALDGALPGRDCNPHNAYGAVSPLERAMLDTIAEAEGTLGRGKDGYDVMFTYQYFDSCEAHPGIKQCSGRLCSTAAGRYQFLKGTWESLRLPNFWPENQDRGALALLARRGIQLPSRPLLAQEFTYVMGRLSFEWASLPPGRYGQPALGYQELWERYCFHASCDAELIAGHDWPQAEPRAVMVEDPRLDQALVQESHTATEAATEAPAFLAGDADTQSAAGACLVASAL